MKRKAVLGTFTVFLMLVIGISPALAQPMASKSVLSARAAASLATALVSATAAPVQSQPAKTEVKKESELKHNIVKYLGYSLFVLIFLTFGSGFFKKKKKYRTIHHALAYALIGVAILHGILALTL